MLGRPWHGPTDRMSVGFARGTSRIDTSHPHAGAFRSWDGPNERQRGPLARGAAQRGGRCPARAGTAQRGRARPTRGLKRWAQGASRTRTGPSRLGDVPRARRYPDPGASTGSSRTSRRDWRLTQSTRVRVEPGDLQARARIEIRGPTTVTATFAKTSIETTSTHAMPRTTAPTADGPAAATASNSSATTPVADTQ